MKTGILKAVSQYGFKVKDDERWHNFNKNTNQVMVEFAKANGGKEIEWEENEKGLVTRIALHKPTPEPTEPIQPIAKGLLMKGFISSNIIQLTKTVNKFGECKEIKATKTHIKGDDYVAFVWYK